MKTTELLTVDEVAELLKCHPQTVRRWIGSGKLGHVKAGSLIRIPEEEVRLMLERPTAEDDRKSAVAALRSVMKSLRETLTSEDIDQLTRSISEGEQPADWESPVE